MALPAILGGEPTLAGRFPAWPVAGPREYKNVRTVLKSGQWWRGSGTAVGVFEKRFAKVHGAPYGLAVTNGTHALELALRALKVGPGDEVIVPAMTFAATAMAVLIVGAKPVLADIDGDTWCISVEDVARKMTGRTKAVIPVHFAGQMADLEGLERLCDPRGVAIIEDAAHAHGARRNGYAAGSRGAASAFSFQNFKLMSAGEGGMLLFTDGNLFEASRLIGNCGRPFGDTSYAHLLPGSNFRMGELTAAVLNAQLDRLGTLGKKREINAGNLSNLLKDFEGIKVQSRDKHTGRHAYYMYIFEYDEACFEGLSRDQFVMSLQAEGIPAYRMYPALQDTAFYKTAAQADLRSDEDAPLSRRKAARGVWLHHRVLLGKKQALGQLADAIAKIGKSAGKIASMRQGA